MPVLTEGRHAGEFIAWELPATASRTTGTVKDGETLVAGQVVERDGDGKLVAFTAATDTEGELIAEAAGVMFDNVDAGETGADADVPGAVLIDGPAAVVIESALTFPAETTEGNERALTIASLRKLGIKVR